MAGLAFALPANLAGAGVVDQCTETECCKSDADIQECFEMKNLISLEDSRTPNCWRPDFSIGSQEISGCWRLVKLLALAVLISLNSGCIGIAVVFPNSKESTQFDISGYGKDLTSTKSKNPSKSRVEALWGKPDRITAVPPNGEVWRYRDGYDWIGVVPILYFPIPIIIPIIPSNIDIYFNGDDAVKVEYSDTDSYGFCYGPEDEGSMKYKFITYSPKSPK